MWDGATGKQCEALLFHTGVYSVDVLRDFALWKWEAMGAAVQRDIALAMVDLAGLLRTVPR